MVGFSTQYVIYVIIAAKSNLKMKKCYRSNKYSLICDQFIALHANYRNLSNMDMLV